MTNRVRPVIYSDLDGSLLDHDSYSHAPAQPLLERLEQLQIPVIPVTSKTLAELLPLRRQLANRHPFVIENGAAVLLPVGYFETLPPGVVEQEGFWVRSFAPPREHWLRLIDAVTDRFADQFSGFASMNDRQVARLTGLSPAAAGLARRRQYGEPLQWHGNTHERDAFIAALTTAGARVLQGGRFLHVGGGCDKGAALQWLQARFRADDPGLTRVSVAVGDSPNDIAMLEAADHALVIRSPHHAPPRLQRLDNTWLSSGCGPRGWAELVGELLDSMDLH